MQDKTIDNALLALRRQIIRGDGKNLAHVEALLRARGVPIPRVMNCPAYRGEMKRLILGALRDGPRTRSEIIDHILTRRPELTRRRASQRTSQRLYVMKQAGLVRREGRVWQLGRP